MITEDVVADLRARTMGSRRVLEDDVEGIFLAAARTSTAAFADWLASGDPKAARRRGLEAVRSFAQLAARDDAPLNEVTKRCLRWHDTVASQLRGVATLLGLEDSLPQALSMLQQSLFTTLVRMTEAFEEERQELYRELVAHHAQIAFEANHDALTGLPNRTVILDRIEQLLARYGRSGKEATVLFIDLDNLKAINDSLGHDVGDNVLRTAVARIKGVLRESDTLGRLGGDEFIVVVDCTPPDFAPNLICGRILAALREPFELESRRPGSVLVTASIGVTTSCYGLAEEMIRNADIAMYQAKRAGKDRYALFNEEMLP